MDARIISARKAWEKRARMADKRASRRGRLLPSAAEKHVSLAKVAKDTQPVDRNTWLDGVFLKLKHCRGTTIRMSLHLEDGTPVTVQRAPGWRYYYRPLPSTTDEVGIDSAGFHHLVSASLTAGFVTAGRTGIRVIETHDAGSSAMAEQRLEIVQFDGIPRAGRAQKPPRITHVFACSACGGMPLRYKPRGADWSLDQLSGTCCPRCGVALHTCERDSRSLDVGLFHDQRQAMFTRHGLVIDHENEPVLVNLRGDNVRGFMEWFQQQCHDNLLGPFKIKIKSHYHVGYIAGIDVAKVDNSVAWRPVTMYPEDGLAY
jgi:hypothetical protein